MFLVKMDLTNYYNRLKRYSSRFRMFVIKKQFYSYGGKCRMSKPGMLRGLNRISIGESCVFGEGLFLTTWLSSFNSNSKTPIIIIGNNCCFGAWNNITGINKIQIGSGCLTGKWVTISDNSHGETSIEWLSCQPNKRPLVSKGPVIIGNNVWIGEKASILAGVSIGEGAVIGANTVVTKDIPPFCVAVGNPMRIIKKNKNNG